MNFRKGRILQAILFLEGYKFCSNVGKLQTVYGKRQYVQKF